MERHIMDQNVFNTVVRTGALSGKDILSVCTVNKRVNGWCDQNFYKEQLEREFGRARMDTDPSIDYKELYKNMQFTYWYRIGGNNRFIDPLQSTNPYFLLDKMTIDRKECSVFSRGHRISSIQQSGNFQSA